MKGKNTINRMFIGNMSEMDNPEKLATSQRQEKQIYNTICVGYHCSKQKHNTICAGHHYSKQKHNTICAGHHCSKQKHNTICAGHHCTQRNTSNVDKTWTLLQTTGSKDELNIVSMPKS